MRGNLINLLPWLALLVFGYPVSLQAQVNGSVFDADNYPLVGATVRWLGGSGTTVDAAGRFVLAPEAGQTTFTISYLGFASREFRTDTVEFPLEVVLREADTALKTVNVTAREGGRTASLLETYNVESVSSNELRKAPCCSLAESFENSPTVDLTYGDPLTGRREIQMLGLRGNYTQLTLEKRPMLDGLATPFALDLIPGPFVEGIQIGKGSGSLESGAAGLTGEINTELIKPLGGPKFYLNLFGSTQGRGEANLLANRQIGKTLWLGAAAHGSFTENRHDHDFDRFKDVPNRQTAVGLLRLFRKGGGNWEGQWNLLGIRDERRGGQQDVHDHGQEILDPYLINQDNQRMEAWGKIGYYGFAKPWQSVGFIYSGSRHELDNVYGLKEHRGEQTSGYLNALYHTRIGNENHLLSVGGIARADDFRETFAGANYDRGENTLGVHGEYTFHWEESREGRNFRGLTAILGLRADRHNLGGRQFSPRLNVKYNPNETSAVRLSVGRGWRSPNLLVDNLNWLPSSREVTDRDGNTGSSFRGLETAWNFGANYTRDFRLGGRDGQFTVDFYRTHFQDQLIVDAEQDVTTLRIYQLRGESYANSFMLSGNYEIFPRIDVKLAYKHNDVRQTYLNKGLREVPLTPRHRLLATLGYDGPRLKIHLNYQWVGEQRLIDFDQVPENIFLPHPQRAPAFGLLNVNVTYLVNAKLEVYVGGDNLTNRTQRDAIIGAYSPFDGYFDASQVYQPLFQRRGHLGIRWTVGS